ncbi:MAG: fluoride efflux transporter CrcB [Gammaproteobacteria bacterium]|nr:fluoride efflux transporter CrcB [Gammaproteobacteria bacterium]
MQNNFMLQFLTVGAGGFIGAGLRFAVGSAVQRALPAAAFPYGTLAVNVIGCFLIGLLAAWRMPMDSGPRLFLMVGLLGGFTTYSAFALETLTMAQQQQHGMAFASVAIKTVAALGAVWAGFELGRLFAN